ncbi:MAG: YHYH protein [Myxococcaceae bacterium]|nr:YHYH protein [Myxococcaceae bacterium]
MRALVLLILVASSSASAHALAAGMAELHLDGSTFTVVLAPLAEHLSEVDDDDDGALSTAEVRRHRDLLAARFLEGVAVEASPAPTLAFLDVAAPDDALVPPTARYVRFTARYEVPSTRSGLTLTSPWGLWAGFSDATGTRAVALRAKERVTLRAPSTPPWLAVALGLLAATAVLATRRRFVAVLLSLTACGAATPPHAGLSTCSPSAVSTTTPTPSADTFNVAPRACTRSAEALACELGVSHRFLRTVGATTVRIDANGVPNHDVGDFPNADNPNTLTPQPSALELSSAPALAATPTVAGIFGIATSGAVFDPNTAELWNGLSAWRYEALRYGSAAAFFASDSVRHPQGLGVDCNLAHVQPGGQYHYHGVPTALASSTPTLTVVGWAADGFPVVARWGRVNGVLVEPRSSYRLRSGERPSPPAGPGGPFDGTFVQDWEFVAGLGDLDACNGRSGPVVIDGVEVDTYHYVLTRTFPFIPRCWSGTPDPSFTRLGAGQTMLAPPRCAAGQTSMCCGDGVCDGPETTATCAEDC